MPRRAAIESAGESHDGDRSRFHASRSAGEVSALLERPERRALARSCSATAPAPACAIPSWRRSPRRSRRAAIATFRYQFPYMEKGGGGPIRSRCCSRPCAPRWRRRTPRRRDLPLLAGGKSMGGRMTSLASPQERSPACAGSSSSASRSIPPEQPGIARAEHLEQRDGADAVPAGHARHARRPRSAAPGRRAARSRARRSTWSTTPITRSRSQALGPHPGGRAGGAGAHRRRHGRSTGIARWIGRFHADRRTAASETTPTEDERANSSRHQRLVVQGVEGTLLSREARGQGHAALLRASASPRSRSTTRSIACRTSRRSQGWAAEVPDDFAFVLKASEAHHPRSTPQGRRRLGGVPAAHRGRAPAASSGRSCSSFRRT